MELESLEQYSVNQSDSLEEFPGAAKGLPTVLQSDLMVSGLMMLD